jgi:hypothetical protein
VQSPTEDQEEQDFVIKYSNIHLNRVFVFDDSSAAFYNITHSVRKENVEPEEPDNFSLASDDTFYFGLDRPFRSLAFILNPNNSGSLQLTIQYWNGVTESWTTIDSSLITDGTSGWNADGTISWSSSTLGPFGNLVNWTPVILDNAVGVSNVDPDAERWWIRISIDSPSGDPKLDAVTVPSETENSLLVHADPANLTAVDAEEGRFVLVTKGKGFFGGELFELQETTKLRIPTHAGTLQRYVSVIVDIFSSQILLRKGIPECTPRKPLIQPFQYKLADILVSAGDGRIEHGDINTDVTIGDADPRLLAGFMA